MENEIAKMTAEDVICMLADRVSDMRTMERMLGDHDKRLRELEQHTPQTNFPDWLEKEQPCTDDMEDEAEEVPAASFSCEHHTTEVGGIVCCDYGREPGQVMSSCKGKRERLTCPK